MGRKTKYSAPSDQRTEIRLTAVQKETLYHAKIMCEVKGLPHSNHDILIAGLNMYYEYLKELIHKNETYSNDNLPSIGNSVGLFGLLNS